MNSSSRGPDPVGSVTTVRGCMRVVGSDVKRDERRTLSGDQETRLTVRRIFRDPLPVRESS